MTGHVLSRVREPFVGGAPGVRAHGLRTLEGQPPRSAPPHSDAVHRAISAELMACTLGQRERLELRTDLAGSILRTWRRLREGLEPAHRLAYLLAPPPSRTTRLRAWLAR